MRTKNRPLFYIPRQFGLRCLPRISPSHLRSLLQTSRCTEYYRFRSWSSWSNFHRFYFSLYLAASLIVFAARYRKELIRLINANYIDCLELYIFHRWESDSSCIKTLADTVENAINLKLVRYINRVSSLLRCAIHHRLSAVSGNRPSVRRTLRCFYIMLIIPVVSQSSHYHRLASVRAKRSWKEWSKRLRYGRSSITWAKMKMMLKGRKTLERNLNTSSDGGID